MAKLQIKTQRYYPPKVNYCPASISANTLHRGLIVKSWQKSLYVFILTGKKLYKAKKTLKSQQLPVSFANFAFCNSSE